MQMQLLLTLCSWNSPLAKFLKRKERALICWRKVFSILRSHSKLLKSTFLKSLCNIPNHIMYEFLFLSMDFQSHTQIFFYKFNWFFGVYFLKRLPALNNSSDESDFANFDASTFASALVLAGKLGITQQITYLYQSVSQIWSRIFFLLFSSYASAKRSSIWWQSIATSAGRILMDPRGVFNNLSMIIESNQQRVQTLLCLAIFTFLIFQLVLLTSLGLWFLKVQCHLFFLRERFFEQLAQKEVLVKRRDDIVRKKQLYNKDIIEFFFIIKLFLLMFL